MGKLYNLLFVDDDEIDIEKEVEESFQRDSNGIASVLKTISFIIWMLCIVVALISIIGLITDSFFGIFGLISSIVTAILTIFIYGFAEIIQILHDIRRKVYYKENN